MGQTALQLSWETYLGFRPGNVGASVASLLPGCHGCCMALLRSCQGALQAPVLANPQSSSLKCKATLHIVLAAVMEHSWVFQSPPRLWQPWDAYLVRSWRCAAQVSAAPALATASDSWCSSHSAWRCDLSLSLLASASLLCTALTRSAASSASLEGCSACKHP